MLWSIPVVLAAVVWWPILDNYLWADDFFTFFRLHDQSAFEYLGKPQGFHLYATTGLVFWAADALFGPVPRPLFCLMLATHLLNVALLFAVIRRLADSDRLACVGAAVWATSPVLEASLGWFSVYGQLLVAAALFALILHLLRAAHAPRLPPWAPLLWAVLLLAAATSFGVGIGLALAMPVVAALLLPPGRARRLAIVTFTVVAVGLCILYVVLARYFAVPGSHTVRFAGNVLRLWPAVLGLTIHLFGYGTVRALTGTLAWKVAYPSTAAALIAALGIGVAYAGFALGSPAARRRLLAVLILAVGGYGIIAAGRAPFFGGGAVGGRVERYHYVGLALVVVALCIALGALAARTRLPERLRDGLVAATLALVVFGWWRSPHGINHREIAKEQLDRTLQAIERSIDAVPSGQPVYIENQEFEAMGPAFIHAKSAFPGWAGVFVVFYPDNVVRGRSVYFVEVDERVRAAMNGRRTSGLLVVDAITGTSATP